ncbi:DUF2515 domain-containing protein [Salipaludibacillus sp. CUR1]|uniref:DUF2515 family protein n=1 Tax=Salipaludibacillus sp. CUR1 TaxID=2820003 RepID=UPI001E2C8FE3|nr:DUF2515 family protein [Salipaludibacillus sp. CUR1]MCE7792131.1 DUF2515 domain-containing protein [Salipaludibacillus sp. CUR1]
MKEPAETAISWIKLQTERLNKDNISRTEAYKEYFLRNPEIKWAYLASMVSRNAGWSMSDLTGEPMSRLLSKEWRRRFFITFERANWMIFSDAYPQLLIYEFSKKTGRPLFKKLAEFKVAGWMIKEWEYFWSSQNTQRLVEALIVNEQHVIDIPVINAPFFKKTLFKKAVFKWQERLHFNTVLFPSNTGNLYGASVTHFPEVRKRIKLGKELAWILLKSPEKHSIYSYFINYPYFGNRAIDIPHIHKNAGHLPLRFKFPEIHHNDEHRSDWSNDPRYNPDRQLIKRVKPPRSYCLTKWYLTKQSQLEIAGKAAFLISDLKEEG